MVTGLFVCAVRLPGHPDHCPAAEAGGSGGGQGEDCPGKGLHQGGLLCCQQIWKSVTFPLILCFFLFLLEYLWTTVVLVCVCVLYMCETWVNLFFLQCKFYTHLLFCFKNYIFGGGVGEVGDTRYFAIHFCWCWFWVLVSYRIQIFQIYVFYFLLDFDMQKLMYSGHGGGWGYSGHSVESIRFMCDTDILLGGFGLFGGRGEYFGRIKVRVTDLSGS